MQTISPDIKTKTIKIVYKYYIFFKNLKIDLIGNHFIFFTIYLTYRRKKSATF